MVNAIQELSNAPDGKYLINLSQTICDFLLSCYKDDGKHDHALIFLLIAPFFFFFLFNSKDNGTPLKIQAFLSKHLHKRSFKATDFHIILALKILKIYHNNVRNFS